MSQKHRAGGVNLIGYLRAESGVGQIGRAMARTLDEAGIPYSLCPYERTRSRQLGRPIESGDKGLMYDTNLICVNADQVEVFLSDHEDVRGGRRNIGVWAWEVDRLPESMAKSAVLLDEIWGISAYTANCLRPWLDRPVRALPLPVTLGKASCAGRSAFGLPDHPFLFLYCFDFDSVPRRKNPEGLIRSYLEAFQQPSLTGLVLKTINGEHCPSTVAGLKELTADRRDVFWIEGYLHSEDQMALMRCCDCYVSLHRAEGFGLTIAEAMALGKPVIATGFSANMEFMTPRNSIPIEYRLAKVGRDADPYPSEALWAEPDLSSAAAGMRELANDFEASKRLGRRASRDIASLHSPKSRAAKLRAILR